MVKLAPAVTAEMEKLLEEEAVEQAAAQAEVTPEEGVEVPVEGGQVTEEAKGEQSQGESLAASESEKKE